MLFALCVLVVVVAGSSLRKRRGLTGPMTSRQKGLLLALVVIAEVILALFAFRQH